MSMGTIVNIVATTTMAEKFDLRTIATMFEETEYEPEVFPGLIFHMKAPKTSFLIFTSGKVNCVGCKCIEDVSISVNRLIDLLDRAGIRVNKDPEIKIKNMVVTHDLGSEINLNSVAITLGLNEVEYEPEQFPGLFYRMVEPKTVVLLFSSGKIVLTGIRRIDQIDIAIQNIKKELVGAGLLRTS